MKLESRTAVMEFLGDPTEERLKAIFEHEDDVRHAVNNERGSRDYRDMQAAYGSACGRYLGMERRSELLHMFRVTFFKPDPVVAVDQDPFNQERLSAAVLGDD